MAGALVVVSCCLDAGGELYVTAKPVLALRLMSVGIRDTLPELCCMQRPLERQPGSCPGPHQGTGLASFLEPSLCPSQYRVGRHTNRTVVVRAARATGSCDNRNFYLVVTQGHVVCVLLSLRGPLTCSGNVACAAGDHSPESQRELGRGRLPLLPWEGSSFHCLPGRAPECGAAAAGQSLPRSSPPAPLLSLPYRCVLQSRSHWVRLISRVTDLSTESSNHRGGARGFPSTGAASIHSLLRLLVFSNPFPGFQKLTEDNRKTELGIARTQGIASRGREVKPVLKPLGDGIARFN
ncbi:uncharacterized protein LOC119053652 [Artibeus jamaicensis]|uniref:uncharacterized protein LOC119053652 n=1 Tax=Artibeus jamaicensis TaxID=9417 RepID=UPI00235A6218|nr:uncharacterized protein LOC119053652 [Artibeus jamaicensis]